MFSCGHHQASSGSVLAAIFALLVRHSFAVVSVAEKPTVCKVRQLFGSAYFASCWFWFCIDSLCLIYIEFFTTGDCYCSRSIVCCVPYKQFDHLVKYSQRMPLESQKGQNL